MTPEDIDLELMLALGGHESNFNEKAISPKGARGAFQIVPKTWEAYADETDDPFKMEDSAKVAKRVLSDEVKRFGDLELALAAYNAGAPRVQQAIKRAIKAGVPTDFQSMKQAGLFQNDSGALLTETMEYVPKVLNRYKQLKQTTNGAIESDLLRSFNSYKPDDLGGPEDFANELDNLRTREDFKKLSTKQTIAELDNIYKKRPWSSSIDDIYQQAAEAIWSSNPAETRPDPTNIIVPYLQGIGGKTEEEIIKSAEHTRALIKKDMKEAGTHPAMFGNAVDEAVNRKTQKEIWDNKGVLSTVKDWGEIITNGAIQASIGMPLSGAAGLLGFEEMREEFASWGAEKGQHDPNFYILGENGEYIPDATGQPMTRLQGTLLRLTGQAVGALGSVLSVSAGAAVLFPTAGLAAGSAALANAVRLRNVATVLGLGATNALQNVGETWDVINQEAPNASYTDKLSGSLASLPTAMAETLFDYYTIGSGEFFLKGVDKARKFRRITQAALGKGSLGAASGATQQLGVEVGAKVGTKGKHQISGEAIGYSAAAGGLIGIGFGAYQGATYKPTPEPTAPVKPEGPSSPLPPPVTIDEATQTKLGTVLQEFHDSNNQTTILSFSNVDEIPDSIKSVFPGMEFVKVEDGSFQVAKKQVELTRHEEPLPTDITKIDRNIELQRDKVFELEGEINILDDPDIQSRLVAESKKLDAEFNDLATWKTEDGEPNPIGTNQEFINSVAIKSNELETAINAKQRKLERVVDPQHKQALSNEIQELQSRLEEVLRPIESRVEKAALKNRKRKNKVASALRRATRDPQRLDPIRYTLQAARNKLGQLLEAKKELLKGKEIPYTVDDYSIMMTAGDGELQRRAIYVDGKWYAVNKKGNVISTGESSPRAAVEKSIPNQEAMDWVAARTKLRSVELPKAEAVRKEIEGQLEALENEYAGVTTRDAAINKDALNKRIAKEETRKAGIVSTISKLKDRRKQEAAPEITKNIEDKIKANEYSLESVDRKIQELKDQLDDTKPQRVSSDVTNKLSKLDKDIADKKYQLEVANRRIQAIKDDIADTDLKFTAPKTSTETPLSTSMQLRNAITKADEELTKYAGYLREAEEQNLEGSNIDIQKIKRQVDYWREIKHNAEQALKKETTGAKKIKDDSRIIGGADPIVAETVTTPKTGGEEAQASSFTASGRINVAPIPNTGENIKPITETMTKLQRITKKAIDVGGVTMKDLGEFIPTTKLAAVKYANDIITGIHEVAHFLDDKLGISDIVKRAMNPKQHELENELMILSRSGSKSTSLDPVEAREYALREGVAEGVLGWMVDPEFVEAQFPNFAKHMRSTMGDDVLLGLREVGDELRMHYGAPPAAQVRSTIRGTIEHIENTIPNKVLRLIKGAKFFAGGDPNNVRAIKEKGYRNWLQKWENPDHYLYEAVELLKKAAGIGGKLIYGKDPISAKAKVRGHGRMVRILAEEGVPDAYNPGKYVTDGLYNISRKHLKKASSEEMMLEQDDFLARMKSEHSLELEAQRQENLAREARGEPKLRPDLADEGPITGIAGTSNIPELGRTESDLAKALIEDSKKNWDADKQRRYQAFADELRDFSNKVLDYGINTGFLAPNIRRDRFYYPLLREIAKDKEGLFSLTGSGRQTKDPLATFLNNASLLIKLADKNVATRAFTDLIDEATKHNKWYSGEDISTIGYKTNASDTGTVRIFREGKPEYYKVDPLIKDTVAGYSEVVPDNVIVGWFGFFSNLLKKGVSIAPGFSTFNYAKDAHARFVLSDLPMLTQAKYTALVTKQLAGEGVKALIKGVGLENTAIGKLAEKKLGFDMDAKLFAEMGGDQMGHVLSSEIDVYRGFRTVLREASNDPNSILFMPMKGVARGWDAYKGFIEKVEFAGRLAEFKGQFEKYKKLGWSDWQAAGEAAAQARGLMDFAVIGSNMRTLEKILPYTNVRVRSIAKMLHTAKERPGDFLLKQIIFSAMPVVLLREWNKAQGVDEDYEQKPDYQRYLLNMAYVAPNTWLNIPVSSESVFMHAFADRAYSYLVNGKKDAFKGYAGNVIANMSPIGDIPITALGKPQVELLANYDFFRGRNIVPYYDVKTALSEREDSKAASRLGNLVQSIVGATPLGDTRLGKALFSAQGVDHQIRGYFGNMGALFLQATDYGREKGGKPLSWGKTFRVASETTVYGTKDVEHVMTFATNHAISTQNRKLRVLQKAINTYFEKVDPAEKEAEARKVYDIAAKMREGIDAKGAAYFGQKKKKRKTS